MALWQFVDESSYQNISDKIFCLYGFIVLNSVINPFLYGMFGHFSEVTRND